MVICFHGVDGSGKTSQAERLVSRLNEAGSPAVYAWTGGRTRLTQIGRRLIKVPVADREEKPAAAQSAIRHRSSSRGVRQMILRQPPVWMLGLQVALLEHTMTIRRRVVPHLSQGRIVVCDRYLYDAVVAAAGVVGAGSASVRRLLRLASFYPVPRPARAFLLEIPAEVALQRKNDIRDADALRKRIPLYRVAAEALEMQIVDATLPAEEVGEAIFARVQPLLGK